MNSNDWVQYWKDRWNNQNTRWHQEEFEPLLVQHFPKIAPTTVLVPLCGKSKDMIYLASLGHQVIGVDLSELACRAFFEENGIEFTTRQSDSFLVFESERIRLFCGDFFGLGIEHTGELRAVYDRAATIALPPEVITRYADHIKTLLTNDGFIFLITIEYQSDSFVGPPFSVSEAMVINLYMNPLSLKILSSGIEQVKLDNKNDILNIITETAYLISRVELKHNNNQFPH